MADNFDVVVVGSGPAGVAAAVAAASAGARVAVLEGDRLGGACVNDACIPLASMLWSATQFVGAIELASIGVAVGGDDDFRLDRAVARKARLVQSLSTGLGSLLRVRAVEVIRAHGRFVGPGALTVVDERGEREVAAGAVVIATGSRWQIPDIAGGVDRIVTPEVVYSGVELPHNVLVMGGGPSRSAFAAEQAFMLAVAGTHATLTVPSPAVLPGLDTDLDPYARSTLEGVGVDIHADATVACLDGSLAHVSSGAGDLEVPCDLLVVGDPRVLDHSSLALDVVGLPTRGPIDTDRAGRTARADVLAAGDVTGACMTSAYASTSGHVAGLNAAGGDAELAFGPPSHVLHTDPEIAWIGLDESTARASRDVVVGIVDLAHTAYAITRGGRDGVVKIVADADLGEIVGVHAVGPGASELIAVAGAFIAMEGGLEDVAATQFWHPGPAESLAAAARDALH